MKVVRFHAGGPDAAEGLAGRWERALAGATAPGRPWRVALAVPVTDADFPPPCFAAVDTLWLGAEAAAGEAWLRGAALGLGPGSCQVTAEEVVARGADRFRARWVAGGERYKMMSFGRRHPGLSREAFAARWRAHGGRLGGEDIPEDVRGEAYVQDHPLPGGDEPPYDAVNEVYLDGLDALRRRRDWFAARRAGAGRPADGLMAPGQAWSLYLRERPLTPPEPVTSG